MSKKSDNHSRKLTDEQAVSIIKNSNSFDELVDLAQRFYNSAEIKSAIRVADVDLSNINPDNYDMTDWEPCIDHMIANNNTASKHLINKLCEYYSMRYSRTAEGLDILYVLSLRDDLSHKALSYLLKSHDSGIAQYLLYNSRIRSEDIEYIYNYHLLDKDDLMTLITHPLTPNVVLIQIVEQGKIANVILQERAIETLYESEGYSLN